MDPAERPLAPESAHHDALNQESKMSVAAIVPAAGAGRRLGGRTGKPFVMLNGKPLLAHALCVLQASPAIQWILLVVRAEAKPQAEALVRRFRITKALPVCAGARSRALSVARGFGALPREATWVLVHDGARPCVSVHLVQRSVQAAKRYGAVACGLPASVTVKAVDERHQVRLTLDRERLWFVQTPQVFRRDWFAEALAGADAALDRFPDDAALVEAAAFPVRMIPGDPINLKVTTREDLILAEAILKSRREPSAASMRDCAHRDGRQRAARGCSLRLVESVDR